MTQELKMRNFMGLRKIAAGLSILLVLASLVSLAINGLKLGLDFTGGTQIEVGFDRPADIPKIRDVLIEEGLQSPVAVLFGSDSEVLIRTQGSMQDAALIKINHDLGVVDDKASVQSVGRVASGKEHFAQEVLVVGANLDLLQQAEVFDGATYGNVAYETRGEVTAVLIEKNLNNVYTDHLLSRLTAETGAQADLRRSEFVGPQVGQELRDQGGLGVLCALLGVMIYVAMRFQWKFSVGAVVALIHDVIITLGIFSVFQLDFDLTVLAAVLAIIGYSINDTIVVFDRIRDNFRTLRKSPVDDVINYSLTQTLERTILTSLTTLLTVVMLYVFGGELIRGFSLALIIGISVGTYSSIYIASAILMTLDITKEDLMPPVKEGAGGVDELP